MNTREQTFAEFVYECVAGHKPRNEFERQGVLELRKELKSYFKSEQFAPVRKALSEKFRSTKRKLSASLTGPDKDTLRRHL